MTRKRHPPEEIIKRLREAATLRAGGQSVEEVCKKLEVSPPTYYRWRQEYGGAQEETIKRLKALEKENGQLKSPTWKRRALPRSISPHLMTKCAKRCAPRWWQSTGKSVIRRLAFGAGKMVGVGDRGRRSASTDGGKT